MSEFKDSFEVIARAVIVQNGKILLCKGSGKEYFFFPGGHVEKGESTEVALKRELFEELGADSGRMSFIGAVENIFRDSYDHHEINLVFEVEVMGNEFQSKEDHLEFEMLSTDKFGKAEVLPPTLKESVLKWLEDKKKFWRSEG